MSNQPILVATDIQARSDRAIDRAFMLGREQDRPVLIVHVLDHDDGTTEERADKARQVRRALPDPDATAEILLPVGSAPRVVAATAVERDAALIVAGVARSGGLRDYIMGTALDHIVRHAEAPVLVVKDRPHAPYRKLLVAVDFSLASKCAVIAAARLFPDARLDVLNAYHVPFEGWQSGEETREEMRQYAQGQMDAFLADPELAAITEGRISGRLEYGNVQDVVREAIEADGPDLLVLGTIGSSGFRQATLGSQASALLSKAAIDTLMVPVPRQSA